MLEIFVFVWEITLVIPSVTDSLQDETHRLTDRENWSVSVLNSPRILPA